MGRVTQVSAGFFHTCGVKSAGTLACWGDNGFGQAPQLTLTPATLPAGQVGTAYSQQLSVSAPPYTPPVPIFTVLSGALPSRLSLSVAGLLDGTPSSGGAFPFTVEAEDDHGFTATQAYSLTITVD